MPTRGGLGALLVAVLACGGGSHVATQPTDHHLTIRPAELRSGNEVISLREGGAVSANGKPVGTLHRDGRFFATDGKLVAKLESSGHIVNATGYVLDRAMIAEDGTLEFQGRSIRIKPGGHVEGLGDKAALKVDVEPAGRRAAMFVLLMAALSGT